ncbi:MAG: flagellar biosynthesis anti-sigma factor FlgM [Thermodesulfobacteriota bacterium]|nr:flagellar biosynthesis anti-sigma factor FlgM [Thermodesulfobacteriota bacterium]
MKILNTNLIHPYTSQSISKQESNPLKPEKKGDSVTLSSGTKDLQLIQKGMETDSETRSAKVNQLKNQVEQGTYTVNAEKTAGAFIDTLI